MEQFNILFDELLKTKETECDNIILEKGNNKKMIVENIENINYSVKTTLSKINAEIDRKTKASKTYKKQQNAQYTQCSQNT